MDEAVTEEALPPQPTAAPDEGAVVLTRAERLRRDAKKAPKPAPPPPKAPPAVLVKSEPKKEPESDFMRLEHEADGHFDFRDLPRMDAQATFVAAQRRAQR